MSARANLTVAIESECDSGTEHEQGERRFLLPGIGWGGYEALLALIGDGSTRVTYCDGDAELMSPLPPHENTRKLLGFLVETIVEDLNLPLRSLGATTYRREDLDHGLEPDDCYYIASAARLPPAPKVIDLRTDPPPDLAIEIEYTTSALRRMPIYAALGVPEVWRHDGEALVFHRRQPDGSYQIIAESQAIPTLVPEELLDLLREAEGLRDEVPWRRRVRAWVAAVVVPRYRERFPADQPR